MHARIHISASIWQNEHLLVWAAAAARRAALRELRMHTDDMRELVYVRTFCLPPFEERGPTI